ncbi:MAG: right-handed parallel beta-helix repeat-containing protein [bacterium]
MSKKIILTTLVVLGAVFGMGTLSVVNAATIYVDAVNGDDVMGDGTEENPYKTIGKGISVAGSGDTVQCAPGTYTETVSIKKQVMLIGAGSDKSIIDASSLPGNPTVIWISNAYPQPYGVSGFKITGGKAGSWFYEGNGIYCDASANPSITNNLISGNGRCGIYCFYGYPTITNNVITENHGGGYREGGIVCSHSSPIITNNTISENSRNGIYCYYGSPPVTNNIISENRNYGIMREVESNPSIDYNNVWGNAGGDYWHCSPGAHDISAEPQFIGGGDYHLQATSPCIDVGSNTAPALPDTDMDGEPRIINGVVDMGADEYSKVLAISIELNDTEFHTGETLTIDAHVTNGSEATTVEVKCWVRFPNSKLKSLLNIPKVTLRPGLDVIVPLIKGYTFKGSEPEGGYEAGGRLACPITLDYFSTDIKLFTFTSTP